MLIKIPLPVIVETLKWSVKKFLRMLDQGYFQCITNCLDCILCRKPVRRLDHQSISTSSTQVYQYLDLYLGPQFIVHYRYASVLTIVMTAMFFGVGLPILFPIAAVDLIVIFCIERIFLSFFYQTPPAMDASTTRNALTLLSLAPIFLLLNGFWMVSNR